MKPQEANKIIAEFMGGPYVGDACQDSIGVNDGLDHCTESETCSRCEEIPTYYLSLDALVPVWEKMENIGFTFRFDKGEWAQPHYYFLIDSYNDEYGRKMNEGKTLQEAAAIATAKAIKELESRYA